VFLVICSVLALIYTFKYTGFFPWDAGSITSIIITFLSVLILFDEILEWLVLKRNHLRIEQSEEEQLNKDNLVIPPDHEIITFKNVSLLHIPSLNYILDRAKNPIEVNTEMYEINPIIKLFRGTFIKEILAGEVDWDDKKVRLKQDLSCEIINKSKPIPLQKTSYFRSLLSNGIADKNVFINDWPVIKMRNEIIDNRGNLIDLYNSKLSNHLGGSAILITNDSKIVYLKQNKTRVDKYKTTPSGSGSFNYYKKKEFEKLTFQEYVRQEVKREILEECALISDDIPVIQICGYGRALHRGGKPDLFCIARTCKDIMHIKPPVKEWEYQQKTPLYYSFDGPINKKNLINGLTSFREFILSEKTDNLIHGPYLYWNVELAIQYLQNIGREKEKAFFKDLKVPK